MMASKTTPTIIIHFLFRLKNTRDWDGEALAVSGGVCFLPAFETGILSLSGMNANGVSIFEDREEMIFSEPREVSSCGALEGSRSR